MDNSISLDISKQVYSQRRIVKHIQQNVQPNSYQQPINYQSTQPNQYHGKLIIINKHFNLSIGPHYPYFIIGFLMVLTVSLLLVYCSFNLIQSQSRSSIFITIVKSISIIMTFWVNLAYLITALSDPGRYKPNKQPIKQSQQLGKCSACKIIKPRNVRHCFTCDVCMIELDHHCPWMSKCVAKNNIKSFYAFLAGIFLMMGLFWFTIYLILSK